MIRLPIEAYPHALALIREAEIRSHLALAHAVIEGRQSGAIFADDPADGMRDHPTSPRAILVAPASGFCFPFGDAGSGAVERFLPEFFARHLPGQPELYPTSAAWHACLDPLFAHRFVRVGYELPAGWEAGASAEIALPPGFTMAPMSAALRQAWQEGLDPWIWRIWGGPEGFEARSFGVAVMLEPSSGSPHYWGAGGATQEKIATFCAACGIGGGEAEVEVGTVPGSRGLGLATAAGRAFMGECARRGLRPAWSCGAGNTPSDVVARKLGFVAIEEVTGYPLSSAMRRVEGRWTLPE